MAVDKAVDSAVLDGYFDDIADSIRAKTGTQSTYTPAQMSAAIDDIPSSDLSEYFGNTMSGSNTYAWQDLIKKIPGPVHLSLVTAQGAFQNYRISTVPKIIFDFSPSSLAQFFHDAKMTSVDTSGFDTSRVNNFQSMFQGCSELTELDIRSFDMSKATSVSYMIRQCSKLETLYLPNSFTSSPSLKSLYYLFQGCSKLTNINILDNLISTYITDVTGLFEDCTSFTSLDLSSWDVSNIKQYTELFRNCSNLTSINLSGWDTSNAENMAQMFYQLQKLETLDISHFDMSKVTNINGMFDNNNKLTYLSFGINLGKGYSTTQNANYYQYQFRIIQSPLLTHDSLMSIINNLYDIASIGVQPQQLMLGSTNLAKLTSAEIAIATNKGWTVS